VATGLLFLTVAGSAYACLCSPEFKAATSCEGCCVPAGTLAVASPSCCPTTKSPTVVVAGQTVSEDLSAPAVTTLQTLRVAASPSTAYVVMTLPRSFAPPTILRI
jgi:hypothetical protein